jgi:hypothetical protein
MMNLFTCTLSLTILLVGISLQNGLLSRAPSTELSLAETGLKKTPTKEPVVASYDFAKIKKQVRADASRLALCLSKNKEFHAPRIRLKINWEGTGALKTIFLQPDAGDQVKVCITEAVQLWNLGNMVSHPGRLPFSYQVTLIPT